LKEQESHKAQAAQAAKKELADNLEEINGINAFIGELPLDAGAIKDIAFQLKAEKAPFFGAFASRVGGKPTLSVAISDDVVKNNGLNAGQIIREIASHIKGGGGGQPFFATAGGKDESGIKAALEAARNVI
jgi:alanyl-tRNA synthetase